jgi:diguanylate cyclase (GGDEF)-like protein
MWMFSLLLSPGLARLARATRRTIWLLASLQMAVCALLDRLTGFDFTASIFYVAPIALTSWFGQGGDGSVAALLSSLLWVALNVQGRFTPLVLWNSLVHVGFFLIIAAALRSLRAALDRERLLARTDPLTGAANQRAMREIIESALVLHRRSQRPLTIAAIDLDGFKQINDTRGHPAGDLLLQQVVATIRQAVRATDTVARLGGDEFLLLFPEADQADARQITDRVQAQLDATFAAGGWPVSASIGVVTLLEVPESFEPIQQEVDHLLYASKAAGKHAIRYGMWPR